MMKLENEARIQPDIWTMPDKGLSWCDCGAAHELSADIVYGFAEELGLDTREAMTHPQLVELTMEVWNFEAVCRFFHLALNEATQFIHGTVAEEYPFAEGIDIVGYFSKTWQGCPAAECRGDD
ncbi:hypothetical protein ACT3UD_08220 [Glutamicibacter sp. 287]|uniref:hypothetical protein n=1 Tax=unclassified Glutamicibacter TaxID=2627139 RepID=UPI000BB82422|nr:hypothetical protein [Glutamicibacter sp. BW80]PCC30224.1 hypothetical protein CIK76_01785 [Glutamicibacter sp. BW80]